MKVFANERWSEILVLWKADKYICAKYQDKYLPTRMAIQDRKDKVLIWSGWSSFLEVVLLVRLNKVNWYSISGFSLF